MQEEEKQPVKNERGIQSVKRSTVRATKRRNPLNQSLLMKMFETIKAIKKDNSEMKNSLIQIKRSQTVLRNKIVRANTEIMSLKDLLYIEKPKQTITLDPNFVPPLFPVESVIATRNLEQKCQSDTYRNQLVGKKVI